MLLMVLITYWLMYSKHPGFLTLSGRDAVELGKFKMLLDNPKNEWLEKLDHRTLTALMQRTGELDEHDIQRPTG